MDIYSSVGELKGVGPKTLEKLNKCGIFTIMDLLLYFPRDYKIIKSCDSLKNALEKQEIIITAQVLEVKKDVRTRTGKVISTVILENEEEVIKCRWFNQPYIKNKFRIGRQYTFHGKLDIYRGEKLIINPKIVEKNIKENDIINEIVMPIYPLREGVKNNTFVKLIKDVLDKLIIEENLPRQIIEKYNFCSLDESIRAIHNPVSESQLEFARRRLKFQELFTYSLKISLLKESRKQNNKGIAFKIYKDEINKLQNKLKFQLTKAQSLVLEEILKDQNKNIPMNRLVQGDVGSGKTILAIIALLNVALNGYQGVLMAPTEILAQQHFIEIKKLLSEFNIRVQLLCGSTSNKAKLNIKKALKMGEIDIIVGTHALIEDDVEFKKLGIVITDEQHRFGVMQRNKLFTKGEGADILVMTATPIPRTLSLYLYGDLDISIIDELPPGRQKVDTYFINEKKRNRIYSFALKEIKKGRQVYVVCPLVEENDQLDLTSVQELYKDLKDNYFNQIEMEILHGKMTPKEKNDIMLRFKNNEVKLLVSTTVIEVGINVPNATIMIIEGAERFGLAQLHQLRGRVGRGSEKSYCILMGNIKNMKTRKRMETLVKSNDGFFIAEQDLKIRGSGEIFGFRQHGEENLILSNPIDDIDILKIAHRESQELLKSNKKEDIKILKYLGTKIDKQKKYICFN
ncbi:ATP-dependent DNA helicase RecG [Clostridium cochlearium]|uniref:ATP-dependent DNA helicase RecG n=1 Tax=Clostridium cochlearium TaxID=1494 RepID=A0A239ZW08_CLOCO|nr:ATP-dependent DNA helicase RecG [Clostridium cochlearium]MBV1818076.1 ATP-dependent DNA helicase RecG [Bacteroidales bacterium MSK.15.36]MBE6064279.1 ATP-dependent DNA helicase RecG [Clostridium cochlearium]MBU5268725.1 ATP-dependent DNA helicase RecG [Clostridium cochlearium]MCG4572278.1 ATP-dependent DNA helicase RecG [Clostridium cochlearium]MCR1970707.1 ATP-dependent DNA helicase RecG [Clostridium cochlearium]